MFTTLAKTLVTANGTFEKGRRFKITERDYLHVNGIEIVHTMVVVNGRFATVTIPIGHVTKKSLENFKVN